MAQASLAFVAGPSTTPTTTFSLDQPGLVKVKADSFSLGELSFDGDPETGTGSYGTRQVEFTLQFTGTYEEAATAIQSVVRQLTQPAPGFDRRNWVMFRWSGSQPFFLAMYPASVGALDWRQSGAGVWEMPVSLTCEFGIYGANEDVTFTITNDPTTGANKMMYAFGAVKGDLETPLVLAQTTGPSVASAPTDGIQPDSPFVLASYSLSGGNTHAFLARDLTELTSGTDMGAPVSGAGARYVGGNYKSCAFTTTTLATRLSGTFSTAFTPMPGLYRAFLRVVTASGAGTTDYSFRLGVSNTSAYVYGDTVTAHIIKGGFDFGALIDLGVFQFPVSSDTRQVGLVPASTSTRAADISIQASASAAVALRFDEIYFVPVETAYGSARLALIDPPTSANVLLYDALNDVMRGLYDASGTAPLSGIPDPLPSAYGFVGGLPTVIPGQNNYLQFFYENSVVTDTAAFTARYYPRYAHAKPVAT